MHLKKSFLLIILSLSLILEAKSQEIDTNKLKSQATEMAQSLLKEDYETLVKYTYYKVVEMGGGSEKMTEMLKKAMDQMKDKGYAIQSLSVGLTPLKAQAGKEIHALVMQTIVLSVPGGSLTSNSYLLAVSADKGVNWQFVDTAQFRDAEKLKSLFPEFNPELKIPEKQPPIFKKSG